MAVAMLSPEPEKLKRKQNTINGDHGAPQQRIADARAVLKYSPELAQAVMYGEKPLQAAQNLGDLLARMKKNKGAAGQGRPKIGGTATVPPKPKPPTLASLGISKNTSSLVA